MSSQLLQVKSNKTKEELRITEIFYSIQGETSRTGLPTVFVRLTGCPLRCGNCDSAYAFNGGKKYSLAEIEAKVASYKPNHVVVTGGEPLAQKLCIKLLKNLCDLDYDVSIETSGAMDISEVDPRVDIVLDLKTPGSGEKYRNLYTNIQLLKTTDEVKFVLCDYGDYLWAISIIEEYSLDRIASVLFSPSHGQLDPTNLADWIVRDNIPVRLQVQLHKYLWGDVEGK